MEAPFGVFARQLTDGLDSKIYLSDFAGKDDHVYGITGTWTRGEKEMNLVLYQADDLYESHILMFESSDVKGLWLHDLMLVISGQAKADDLVGTHDKARVKGAYPSEWAHALRVMEKQVAKGAA